MPFHSTYNLAVASSTPGAQHLYLPVKPVYLHAPYRWEQSKATYNLMLALNQSRPRVIVHHHDGFGGLGEYLIDRWLRPLACRFRQAAAESDCRVVLTTTLREPAARAISNAAWSHSELRIGPLANRTQLGRLKATRRFASFASKQSNFMTKCLLFGSDLRVPQLGNANLSFDASLLKPAVESLKLFDLVGRTEELQRFRDRLDSLMGWATHNDATSMKHNHNNSGLKKTWQSGDLWQGIYLLARKYNAIDYRLYNSFCRRPRGDDIARERRRVVQPLCSVSPYPFPRYWARDGAKGSCEENLTKCNWVLVPKDDGRSCRAGDATTREPLVVCERHNTGSPPSSTLRPYRRRPCVERIDFRLGACPGLKNGDYVPPPRPGR